MKRTYILGAALLAWSGLALAHADAQQLNQLNAPPANAQVRPLVAAPAGGLGAGMFAAHVSSAGVLLNGAGATGATIVEGYEGNYEVDFDRDVSNCFYTASSYVNTVATYVEPRSTNAKGVFLEFFSLGSPTANPIPTASEFYLQVYCAN